MYFSARTEGRISYGHLGTLFVSDWYGEKKLLKLVNRNESYLKNKSGTVFGLLYTFCYGNWENKNIQLLATKQLWEGAVWDLVEKLGFISWLVVNGSGWFRFVCSYILSIAVSVVDGLATPKPLSQVVDMETDIFVSGRVSVSGITLIPRPSRARDLVTMAEVGSTRLTSLERIITGVGSVSRGPRGET